MQDTENPGFCRKFMRGINDVNAEIVDSVCPPDSPARAGGACLVRHCPAAGYRSPFSMWNQPVSVTGNEAVEEIADDCRYQLQRPEESPSAAKVPEYAKDSRRAKEMTAGFCIDDCIELIIRQSGLSQHLSAFP